MTFHSKLLNWFENNRYRFPDPLNRIIDSMADVVRDVVLRRWRSTKTNKANNILPPAIVVPPSEVRVLIAPANYAGQGHAWAQAINEQVENASAVNLSIQRASDFGFASNVAVPQNLQQYSREWQIRESSHICRTFTHVLVEAELAIFGSLFGHDPEKERILFSESGISTAYVCHGSDIRSPEVHRTTTKFSPFVDVKEYNSRLQRRVDKNRAFLKESGSPVFVSTPDLTNDYPGGIWLPLVVDREKWAPSLSDSDDEKQPREVPLVIHTPSKQRVKGSQLIEPSVRRLVEKGLISYRSVTGVSSEDVRRIVLTADIVLDQFRLGSYGVAACEAMAAGKAVIGHVTPQVRSYLRQQTGMELPIVEANPETIEYVLAELANDPTRIRILGAKGQEYISRVHSGHLSALLLKQHWLDR